MYAAIREHPRDYYNPRVCIAVVTTVHIKKERMYIRVGVNPLSLAWTQLSGRGNRWEMWYFFGQN